MQAAADAFRERGVDGVGVADVMERAGLTHGGFYAHFRSKDDLVKTAFEQMALEVADTVGATDYLAERHMLHPERGCPLPTVATELARSGPKMRRSVAGEIRARLARIVDRLGTRRARETDAAGALACMVGGLVIARALPEDEGSAFLERCRAFLRGAIGKEIL
ncbi:MAG: helix-turn-helix domain-containing protein [Candidatus Cybelea sp.]